MTDGQPFNNVCKTRSATKREFKARLELRKISVRKGEVRGGLCSRLKNKGAARFDARPLPDRNIRLLIAE